MRKFNFDRSKRVPLEGAKQTRREKTVNTKDKGARARVATEEQAKSPRRERNTGTVTPVKAAAKVGKVAEPVATPRPVPPGKMVEAMTAMLGRVEQVEFRGAKTRPMLQLSTTEARTLTQCMTMLQTSQSGRQPVGKADTGKRSSRRGKKQAA